MSMPDIAKRAQSMSNELIARHGCEQAKKIAVKVKEKVEAAWKAQQRSEDGSRKRTKRV